MIRHHTGTNLIFSLLMALAFSGCAAGPATEAPLQKTLDSAGTGGLASLSLPAPKSAAERNYLGIPEASSFSLGDIEAEILLIEIFDMYCPYCQKEAPSVNLLYNMIQRRPELRDRLKMIGIGWGNSEFEVDLFKRKYSIPFPLLPDKGETITKVIELKGTPNFTVVRKRKDGTMETIYNESEHLEDVAAFLSKILVAAGLE
jgi:peroxiredoxin